MVGRTTVVGTLALCIVVIKYMPFEVRIVGTYLTFYNLGPLYIFILVVIM